MGAEPFAKVPDDPWVLVYEGFDPGQEGLREALCTLGNGRFATRGAGSESSADGTHYPGTYAAGVFNRLETEIAGRRVVNEDMVNMPNWLCLQVLVGEERNLLSAETSEVLAWRQELDLARGILTRELRLRDPQGRTTGLVERRLVSMADPMLAAVELDVTAEDWAGPIEIRSGLDGSVTNSGVERYRALPGRHLGEVEVGEVDPETVGLSARTSQSRIGVGMAARTRVRRGGKALEGQSRIEASGDRIDLVVEIELEQGKPVAVEKVASLVTSRDVAISEPATDARKHVARAPGFRNLLARHSRRWFWLWERAGMEIRDGDDTNLILNLHIFHLLQVYSDHSIDLDAGIPARGLHGEAYRGHIFWDEIFILPFLDLTVPELARAALRYRHRRLPEARAVARDLGHGGALYPWQSGSDGREETQVMHLNPRSGRWIPDNSHRQWHINHAVAYNIWHYYQSTGDIEFLATFGAEVMLEIARFWSSVAEHDPERDRYVIRGVMGPDEYHDGYPDDDPPAGLDNNAYTNVMAAWVLGRALQLLQVLPPERMEDLWDRVGLSDGEIARWDELTRRLFVPMHDGVISQFEGYEKLEELDWDAYREKYGDIHRLDRILEAEDDSPNRYKLSKQADALMIFYLLSAESLEAVLTRLGYSFDQELIPRTIDYYMSRTSHGSTLSRVVDSWVLARRDREGSWRLLESALRADIADVQGGTTQEGIHLGAMAGTVDIVQRAYTGIEPRGDVLWFNPWLPGEVRRLELTVRYRRHWGIKVVVEPETLTVTARPADAPPIMVGYHDQVKALAPGSSVSFELAEQERASVGGPGGDPGGQSGRSG